jgi:hypothetical protein
MFVRAVGSCVAKDSDEAPGVEEVRTVTVCRACPGRHAQAQALRAAAPLSLATGK